MKALFSITVTGAVFAATMVFAQDCVSIENDLDRLACYDKENGRTATSEVTASPEGNWVVRSDTSQFKDTTDVFMSVLSDEPVNCGSFGSPRRATLMLRCMENTTSLIISTNCHLASGFQGYGQVEYRVDDRSAKTKNFEASTDNNALGLWSGGRSIPVIKEMFQADRLLMRFTPFSQSPVTVRFNIAGVEDAADPLRKACSW